MASDREVTDPASLAEAAQEDADSRVTFVLEGCVLDAAGAPACGAEVVSSAGGRTITDDRGQYRLEIQAPAAAQAVVITAFGLGNKNQVASSRVGLAAAAGRVHVGPLVLARGQACVPSWLPTFGIQPGADETVSVLAAFDSGSGVELYVGGDFRYAGNVDANGIARWDGVRWTPLGGGVSGGRGEVLALEWHDDGAGPALYAGGEFTSAGGVSANRIARWDGNGWSRLGNGFNGSVHALEEHDDGTGPALFAAGEFSSVAGNRIARWDGASWSALGSGLDAPVLALAVHDDGSGPALYAAGQFTTAGGVAASRIARWDGASWSALGSGMNADVWALAVFDDGSGPALYAGGHFTTAGGVAANRIAKWDGASWSALGSGTMLGGVHDLAVHDDGGGPALYAGGSFTHAGGGVVNRIAKWDGASWSVLGGGVNGTVWALAEYDEGSGPALFAAGSFFFADGKRVTRIARWQGSSWSSLGSGLDGPSVVAVRALAVHDDGGGPALYVGGSFDTVEGLSVNKIVRWDGNAWTEVGNGPGADVHSLLVFDDGTGPALYAGSWRWDGTSWERLGSLGIVLALAGYDDGAGSFLYAGGGFTMDPYFGGFDRIARWDVDRWRSVGGGMSDIVRALTVHDDGSGPALYAGGLFTSAGGVAANHVAKWDGAAWAPLGSGTDGLVAALASHDDGAGPALYAGGTFTSAGGTPASRIAKWNGSSWEALGSGVSGNVTSLAVHDDGGGTALYVGGSFFTVGGVAAYGIARWDGASWSPVGSGAMGTRGVNAMATWDGPDGSGPALVAGGTFRSAWDSGDSNLAFWGCDSTPPALVCPPQVLALESLGGPPGEIVTFSITATDDHDPAPVVLCQPPSGSFFARGSTLVTCTATDASGNQSSCQFPVIVTLKARRR